MYEKELRELVEKAHLKFNDEMIQQWLHHLEILMEWNQAYSLTAVKTLPEMLILHIMDSLSIASHITGQRMADIGSGAGFPGITLAILFPEKEFTLLESNRKKCQFLQQVMYDLKLKNVQVVNERVENYRPEQQFDQVMSRAFASLIKFFGLSKHLCRANGQLLAMKGEYPEAELDELKNDVQMDQVQVEKLSVIDLKAARHLIMIQI